MRLIDVDKLKLEIGKHIINYGKENVFCDSDQVHERVIALKEAFNIIDNAEIVSSLKHGRILYDDMGLAKVDGEIVNWYQYVCSECHHPFSDDDYKYCPYCGAKMDETEVGD